MSRNIPHLLIASAQVPFTRGGAEVLVDSLRKELMHREFIVDVVQLPFAAEPKAQLLHQIALWRALDLREVNGKRVDLVICTKFPSYMIAHPHKVVWLVHQHRQVYDLYGSRFGDFTSSIGDETIRRMVIQADTKALHECREVFTISDNVRLRLKRYLNVDSTAISPPLPLGDRYHNEVPERYILSVGRLCSIKRVDLIIKAMPMIEHDVALKIVGSPDEPTIEAYLQSEIAKHHLQNRVEFLGRVDDQMLLSLYARSLAVFYGPFDEDYGFVTLEALASGKPVVTTRDSGGVLEFIKDGDNGVVVNPEEPAIAESVNRLYRDHVFYDRLCRGAKQSFTPFSWDEVIGQLTASLNNSTARESTKAVVGET